MTQCSAPSLNLSINQNNNRITNGGFSYDLAGNLTTDGTYTYTWNAEGRLTSTNGVNYTYDGDNRRVKKSSGKLYWYGLKGEVLVESDLSGNITSEYIYLNGQRIARRDPATGTNVYYYLADRLGSARVMVRVGMDGVVYTGVPNGIVEESDFLPYGTERPPIYNDPNSPDNPYAIKLESDAGVGTKAILSLPLGRASPPSA